MAKKKTDSSHQSMENVESALSRAELFIENNQKTIIYIVLAIALVVVGFWGYKKLIIAPKAKEAITESFPAEHYFETDSFRLALEGDGVNYGFLDIIDNYGNTPYGNLARYYSGVCYMRLGEYEAAIEYLKSFDTDEDMIYPNALGLIGDANLELGDQAEAVKYYKMAAKEADNEFLSPVYLMKAGKVYELMGSYEDALKLYEKIEKEYYGNREQRMIEKYITRAKLKMNS